MTAVISRFLPTAAQLRMSLEMQQRVLRNLSAAVSQPIEMSVQEQDDKFLYTVQDCMACGGFKSDEPMCTVMDGTIQQSMAWVIGKDFQVREIECRAMGAKACVWEISKKPIGG